MHKDTFEPPHVKTNEMACAPSKESDQPGRVFAVRMKTAWVLSYPLSAQRRLIRLGGFPGWSESSLDAQSFWWFCHEATHVTEVAHLSAYIVCRSNHVDCHGYIGAAHCMKTLWKYMSQLMRLWYLSHTRRPAKAQASLRICAVSLEPSLVAHIKYGSRRRIRPKIRHLAPSDGCACAFDERVYGGRKVP